MKFTRTQMLNQLLLAELGWFNDLVLNNHDDGMTKDDFFQNQKNKYNQFSDEDLENYHKEHLSAYYENDEDVKRLLAKDEIDMMSESIKKYLYQEMTPKKDNKKLRIGIYGSSFDPVTNVHLWTASTVAQRAKLDKVIFLPSSNKRTDKEIQTSKEHRLAMLEMAVRGNEKFEVDPYELGREGYEIDTYRTMGHFQKKYPDAELYFIMGADLLVDIGKGLWRSSDKLIKENKFIVMARDGIDMLKVISSSPLLRNEDDGSKFHLIDKGLAMEISSTYIRDEFAMGGEPRYLLPTTCYNYIKTNGLYNYK